MSRKPSTWRRWRRAKAAGFTAKPTPSELPHKMCYTCASRSACAGSSRPGISRRRFPPGNRCTPSSAGNTVVLKPAEDTPHLRRGLLVRALEEAGIPAGVVNLVHGQGRTTGRALVRPSGRGAHLFHGLHPHRRRRRDDVRSKRQARLARAAAARTPRSSSPTRTWTSPSRARSGAPSERPASAARRRAACSSTNRFTTTWSSASSSRPSGSSSERASRRARRWGRSSMNAELQRVLEYIQAGTKGGAELRCGGKRARGPAVARAAASSSRRSSRA